jgi:hypothetical protein
MNSTGAGIGARYGSPEDRERYGTAPSYGRTSSSGPSRQKLGDALNAIFVAGKQAFSNLFELLSLELHRAGVALVWMVALGALGALMVVTAWFGLMAALALWLISLDIPPAGAVLITVGVNLAGAAIILFLCMKKSRDLAMPATRRQLKVAAAEVKVS